MKLDIYQIDAFANQVFEGNPAAVVPLKEWLPDELLQKIAVENNLSETAFIVLEKDSYRIRWFTPGAEVDLCGHATLASGYVFFEILNHPTNEIRFNSRSGELIVSKQGDELVLDFPRTKITPCEAPDVLVRGLGKQPIESYLCDDYMLVFESEQDIASMQPDFNALGQVECRGIIVTAASNEYDFVSRFFTPQCGINEDPVTGSAHCALAPYWAEKLDKRSLNARQISSRGGNLRCDVVGDRVFIAGKAIKYLQGTIEI